MEFFPGFKPIRIASSGAEINGVVGGSGPPVLLLHGWPQTHLIWRHVAPLLSQRFTVVATDLRGYGDSSKPPEGENHAGYSKRAMAQDQVEVMRRLGFERFAVVGHDRGGRVACRMALDHPQTVTRLALLDIVPTRTVYTQVSKNLATWYFHWFFLIQPAPLPEMLLVDQAEPFLRNFAFRGLIPDVVDEPSFAEYLRCFADPHTLHAMCEDYRAGASIDLQHDEADLGTQLPCPTLVLWGVHGAMHRLFDVLETGVPAHPRRAAKLCRRGIGCRKNALRKCPPPWWNFSLKIASSSTKGHAMPSSKLFVAALVLAATTASGKPVNDSDSLPQDNPFARESTLPYRLPPFDKIGNEDFKPALLAGMAAQRKEMDAIAKNPAAPTFENTIVAMERSGELLTRVSTVFGNLASSNTNPQIEALQTEMAPKLSAHTDAIYLDPALYGRVRTLYDQRASLELDPESLRLLERYHTKFVRAGAKLSDADKTRLKQLNEQISKLTTEFRQTVLKGVNAAAVVVDNRAELDGMSDEQIATAAEAAKERKLDGKYVIALLNTTTQPALAQLRNRALRERIYRTSTGRGWGGEFDTTGEIAQIVKLRAERAALLGYPTHAAYVLEDETALNAGAVNSMLKQLAPPAVANARREAAEIQALIDSQAKANGTQSFKLEAWDWDFYAEQVRKAKYSYDDSQVRPYFEMNRVLVDGVLFAAHELYGLSFKERKDLPTYQPDVRVFEVFDADGTRQGLFLVDWYARSNKRGGAWMNSFVEQARLLGTQPVVVNNLNIPKPPAGQPTLLTSDEVNTAFHEFGHALHGLFSDVQYPEFSGTSVPRDFVEYPSQYNEMWMTDPRVFANYARHYQTGAPMPKELMDKVLAARKFNQGYATTEYLAAAILDQAWHQLPADKTPAQGDVAKFESDALKAAGIDFAPVPPRYRSTYFSHIFASPIGYSAGYYAYIWSEVLARDTEHWFDTHGGLKRENGDLLRQKVLSRGYSADALTLFRDFYGKGPEIGPLLEARGLTGGTESSGR